MNLDTVMGLCKMIDHTYKIIAAYFDSDGKLIFISSELRKEDHLVYYLKQTGSIVQLCMMSKDIQISIDDIALTWIGVPVKSGDIVRGYIILGPFYSSVISENALMEIIHKMNISEDQKASVLNYHSIINLFPYKEYVKLIKFLFFYLYNQELDESKLGIISQSNQINNVELQDDALESNNEMEVHGTYLFERCMLECIRTGNIVNLKQVLLSGTIGKVGAMIIGNELRQAKNTFIVATTIVVRAAIEGGLNSEIAFSISDLYIRQIEMMKTVSDIGEQTEKMLFDFAGRVHKLLKINAYSYYVNQCCDYIQTNVYCNISVNQIADVLKISQEHLSRVFKHETGMAVNEYIKKIKMKEAKFLLKYTDNSLVEISEKLAFSSQSHFQTVFKNEMGLTPKQYRDKVK